MDCFNIFSYSSVNTFIQSFKIVYRFLKFENFSFGTRNAIHVIRAVPLVAILPKFEFRNDNVDDVFAAPDPIKFSQINESIIFVFKIFKLFLF